MIKKMGAVVVADAVVVVAYFVLDVRVNVKN